MKKLIMDIDIGTDDALALAYAVSLEEYDLIGVTAAFGNVDQKTSQKNALKVLKALKREDVPVYPGEVGADGRAPYVPRAQRVHGENGLGNVDFPDSDRAVESTPAWAFIASSIEEYGKDLTLFASGPLTNLARVYRERPDLVDRSGSIVVMGGALFVEGNVSPTAEANTIHDPEAAGFLFSLGLDIVSIGLDVTERIHLSSSDMDEWRSECGERFRKMTEFYIGFHTMNEPNVNDVCFLHDPAAALYLSHPELFTVHPFPIKVALEGDVRGRTYASYSEGIPCTTRFAIDVDKEGAERCLKESWNRLFSL